MRGVRRGFVAAIVGWLLVPGGCSTVPVEEVQVYTQAFDEARIAGNRLYDEISPTVTRAQAEAEMQQEAVGGAAAGAPAQAAVVCLPTFGPTPYPPCFDPAEFLPGQIPGEPAALAARRRALDTIATFNTIALRLASGESAGALGAEIRRLGRNAATLATFTGAGVGVMPLSEAAAQAIGRLAGWAETLRADRERRQALAAGEPIIQTLITALIDDAATMYAFKRTEVEKQLTDLAADAGRASRELMAVARRHTRPDGTLATELSRIDQAFTGARGRIGGFEFVSLTAIAGSNGAEPFDAGTARQLESLTGQMEAIADAHHDRVEALTRYHAALGEYVAMLHLVGDALDRTAAAARAPQAVTVSAADLAARATEIRQHAREVRLLLNSL